jgi:hypothetical protein
MMMQLQAKTVGESFIVKNWYARVQMAIAAATMKIWVGQ